MIAAVIGSRGIDMRVDAFIPVDVDEIVTGGALGVDKAAELYAQQKNIPCRVIRPDYEKYGRKAPIVRDKEIVEQADIVIALWDGVSKGTKFTLEYAEKLNKDVRVYIIPKE